MGQRITIQYSVEETELKYETYRLLTNSLARLTSINAGTPDVQSVLTIGTLKEVNALREEMARIDIMLEDVSAIIDGYVRYEHGVFLGESTELDDSVPAAAPDIEGLQQKLQGLKHALQEPNEVSD
jgi:hypothetical protein|tara:strand:- start:1226 stop:1603 length:378 start_codon:yes stop_codon:yes gene_type:complete